MIGWNKMVYMLTKLRHKQESIPRSPNTLLRLALYPVQLHYEYQWKAANFFIFSWSLLELRNCRRKASLKPGKDLWPNASSISSSTKCNCSDKTGHSLSLALSWTKVYRQICCTKKLGHQIHVMLHHFLFQVGNLTPPSSCKFRSIHNLRPLQPRNVAHLIAPLRVTRRYAPVVWQLKHYNMSPSNRPVLLNCTIISSSEIWPIRFPLEALV